MKPAPKMIQKRVNRYFHGGPLCGGMT